MVEASFLRDDLKEEGSEFSNLSSSGELFQRVAALTAKDCHPWSSALTSE